MRRLLRSLFRLGIIAFVFVLGIVVINTIAFTSRQVPVKAEMSQPVDEGAPGRLAQAIQIPTISYPGRIDTAAFLRLDTFLRKAFPLTDSLLERRKVNEFSILYKWPGQNPKLKPILLMGHLDVVPADSANLSSWDAPPFSGETREGYLYGRGALDIKNVVLGLLEATEQLLSEGYAPQRSIYLAFGHDEETLGQNGAGAIAEVFREEGIEFEFILDEGMMILKDALSGLSQPLAMIGIAEKGYVTLALKAEVSETGHSSRPPEKTAIGLLSKAITRLEEDPFPARIDGATEMLFQFAGPEMSLPYRLLFSNLWLTRGLIKMQLKSDPGTNTLIRTTIAPTILRSGFKDNVLPSTATAKVNFRILPGETVESVTERVRQAINDPLVAVQVDGQATAANPSPLSGTQTFGFEVIQRTSQEIFEGIVVAPALFVAITDSRYYREFSDQIYRYSPAFISREDLPRYHGVNERISLENYRQMIRFYRRLIENSCK